MTAALLMAGCGGSSTPPPPVPAPTSSSPASGAASGKPTSETLEPTPEADAQALFEEAQRLEKTQAERPDLVLSGFHDVSVRHPFTTAGRRAASKCVDLEASLLEALHREFQVPHEAALKLRKEGRFGDAVAGLRSYLSTTTKEILKRRATAEIAFTENEARRVYGEAVTKARESAKRGVIDEAVALLKSASEPSTSEVREGAARDLANLDEFRRAGEARKTAEATEAAQSAFGNRAHRLLKRLKERAYAEVLAELDAAVKDPALAGCRDRLAGDRAVVAAAAAFWEAVQKNLKARVNQEVTLLTAEGKFIRGILKRIQENGASLRIEPSPGDVPLESLHTDQVLLFGFGREGLPEQAGTSCAAAAMWLFLEGRHDISRLELATARELGAEVDALEAAWRRGFFRAAIGK
ncbi:MAG TPA: hypothetical protein VGK61_05310 [Planctomycetota bacterium]